MAAFEQIEMAWATKKKFASLSGLTRTQADEVMRAFERAKLLDRDLRSGPGTLRIRYRPTLKLRRLYAAMDYAAISDLLMPRRTASMMADLIEQLKRMTTVNKRQAIELVAASSGHSKASLGGAFSRLVKAGYLKVTSVKEIYVVVRPFDPPNVVESKYQEYRVYRTQNENILARGIA